MQSKELQLKQSNDQIRLAIKNNDRHAFNQLLNEDNIPILILLNLLIDLPHNYFFTNIVARFKTDILLQAIFILRQNHEICVDLKHKMINLAIRCSILNNSISYCDQHVFHCMTFEHKGDFTEQFIYTIATEKELQKLLPLFVPNLMPCSAQQATNIILTITNNFWYSIQELPIDKLDYITSAILWLTRLLPKDKVEMVWKHVIEGTPFSPYFVISAFQYSFDTTYKYHQLLNQFLQQYTIVDNVKAAAIKIALECNIHLGRYDKIEQILNHPLTNNFDAVIQISRIFTDSNIAGFFEMAEQFIIRHISLVLEHQKDNIDDFIALFNKLLYGGTFNHKIANCIKLLDAIVPITNQYSCTDKFFDPLNIFNYHIPPYTILALSYLPANPYHNLVNSSKSKEYVKFENIQQVMHMLYECISYLKKKGYSATYLIEAYYGYINTIQLKTGNENALACYTCNIAMEFKINNPYTEVMCDIIATLFNQNLEKDTTRLTL